MFLKNPFLNLWNDKIYKHPKFPEMSTFITASYFYITWKQESGCTKSTQLVV